MAQALNGKSIVLSGGKIQSIPVQNKIYEMKCFDGLCEWTTLPSQLKKEMSYHASMFVPNDSFDCGDGQGEEEERK